MTRLCTGSPCCIQNMNLDSVHTHFLLGVFDGQNFWQWTWLGVRLTEYISLQHNVLKCFSKKIFPKSLDSPRNTNLSRSRGLSKPYSLSSKLFQ